MGTYTNGASNNISIRIQHLGSREMAQKSRVRSPRAGSQHPALVAHNRPQVQIQGIQCPLCPLKYVHTPCAHKDAHPQVKIKILKKNQTSPFVGVAN